MTTATEAFEKAKIVHDRRKAYGRHSFVHAKAQRTLEYLKNSFGWKLETCTACSGSGYYDHNGSPACGCCEGTGKQLYRGEKAWPAGEPMELSKPSA